MVVLVQTVETGTSLMETDCQIMVIILWLREDNSYESSLVEDTGVIVHHLVYIAVLLRPLQSTVMTTLTPLLERQSL